MSPADLVTIHATSPIQQAVYIHNSPPLFVEDLSVVLLCYYNYEPKQAASAHTIHVSSSACICLCCECKQQVHEVSSSMLHYT